MKDRHRLMRSALALVRSLQRLVEVSIESSSAFSASRSSEFRKAWISTTILVIDLMQSMLTLLVPVVHMIGDREEEEAV